MITNFFIPELNNHDVQELWFQQDGATYHTVRATIDLLKDTFGDRLISRFGPVNWPPRSCDLTPLGYFLWGYVKSMVYADKPQTLDHLNVRYFQNHQIKDRRGGPIHLINKAVEKPEWRLSEPEGPEVLTEDTVQLRGDRSGLEGSQHSEISYPYYLRRRFKEPEGLPEKQGSTGIDNLPQNNLRRRSFSVEALDGDPADRST
ncbi:uncharacterized protein TNCV_2805941 [Trichonephila clavipes]|nr:uncharacterized protein TNCV_2805941 [Trichonephila clavipes]